MQAFLASALITSAVPSFPVDQCQYLTVQQATRAVRVLQSAGSVATYCAPCGQNAPEAVQVESVNTEQASESEHSVRLNGQLVDIAHLYVDRQSLAWRVGCRVDGIPRRI